MKSRTENMQVDIDSVPKELDACLEIEFLNRLDSWRNFEIGLIEKPKLVRYIVALYSYDSFLNHRTPIPLQERKQRALSFAEIQPSNDVTNELLLLENDLILKMIQDYLIAQRNNIWTEIVTTEQQYEEAVRLRLQPIKRADKDKDQLAAAELKKKLRLDCKEMQVDLERFYNQFYLDHEDLKNKVRDKATTLEMLAKSTANVQKV